MDEWSDSVRIAIDLFVACVIISALLVCITLGGRISNYMDNSVAAAADVKAYRIANAYDGTVVYPQDIVNLVLTNQGEPAVYVKEADGSPRCSYTTTGYTTSLSSEEVAIAVSAHTVSGSTLTPIADQFMKDTYLCTLDYYADGGIKSFTFTVTP